METGKPALTLIENCDRIIMHEMRFQVRIGVKKKERATPQPVHLDITMYRDTRDAGESDSVHDTIDYAVARRLISERLQQDIFRLIEAVAAAIAKQLFDNFDTVLAIQIKVKKPQALTDSRYAAVEIFRTRP